jgi:biopolymer transport protein ExbD
MSGLSIPAPGSSGGSHKRGRPRRKRNQTFSLQLTSMMDVLIIIVIFLLKSYGLSIMQVPQEDKMTLPISRSTELFGEGIVLMIAKDQIMIDSEPVVQFQGDWNEAKFELPPESTENALGGRILPVYDILKRKKEEFDTLASRSENPAEAMKKWTGELLVQADKDVPYDIIRRVMFTAGVAGYKQFRLTVEKQAED